jgi:hypothetical protein
VGFVETPAYSLSNFQKCQRNTTNTALIDIFRSSGNSKNSKNAYIEKSTDKQRRTPILSALQLAREKSADN